MSYDEKESKENLEDLDKPVEKEEEGPQPLEFKAILYPNGELKINCALMNNQMFMRGFIDLIHDGVKNILNTPPEQPKIVKPNGSRFLDGIRRMK